MSKSNDDKWEPKRINPNGAIGGTRKPRPRDISSVLDRDAHDKIMRGGKRK
ncbi:MAG TPA: hypothetical protein VKY22_29395 [Bradyrhizobium sp.]|nr:hypothetical protein [Bradyrhizobium sp.]